MGAINKNLIYSFFILLAILLYLPSHAGWSDDIRLTYREHEIHPQVIARNDTVHVIWFQMSGYVSYMRSTDNGVTWDSLINLSEDGHYCHYPDLSLGENGLLVTWQAYYGFRDVGYTTSDDGSTWSEVEHIYTDNLFYVHEPASTVKGDSIFITYYSYRADSTGESPLRFFSSYDYGQTWNDEVTIDYPYSTQQRFLIKYCGGILLSVRAGSADSLHSNYHILGYRSTDAGQSWSDTIWISPENELLSQGACVACNEETGQFAVGYQDHRYQQHAYHGDTFIKTTTDGGQTWPFETQASFDHTTMGPDIDYIADTLMTVWSDRKYYDQGMHEIFFNRSNDNGFTWEGETRLTFADEDSHDPWVSYDNGNIHVVWWDEMNGPGFDIYYKVYTPDTNTAITGPAIVPANTSILTYPNPFNSSLSITFNSKESGILQIYDILGNLVREYEYQSGAVRLEWDACDFEGKQVSSGVYFIKQKGEYSKPTAQRVIYLR